jgi:SAM-dependent methyltransferase
MTAFSDVAAAYEGLEALDRFTEPGSLEAYRASMLERTAAQAAFVRDRLDAQRGSVLEIGSGNGRLLLDLARSGHVTRALGIELSESRTAFAQRWARDLDCASTIEFRAGDALSTDLGGEWDLAACITGTFGYFDAFVPGSATRLLQALHDALRPGGALVLELYPHPAERRLVEAASGTLRTWRELDEGDPWRFYLSEFSIDGSVLSHRKTFVHRTSGEIDEGRSERLVLYTASEIEALLDAAGFGEAETFAGWDAAPYADGDLLVVTGRRR